MTIRRKTMAETVQELRVITENRKSRIIGLTKLIKTGKVTAKDLEWIKKEIEEHEKWIADTEKVIKRFYAPAA